MHQKKLALVNDVTGYGRCSIAVALPIVSALKRYKAVSCRRRSFPFTPAFTITTSTTIRTA